MTRKAETLETSFRMHSTKKWNVLLCGQGSFACWDVNWKSLHFAMVAFGLSYKCWWIWVSLSKANCHFPPLNGSKIIPCFPTKMQGATATYFPTWMGEINNWISLLHSFASVPAQGILDGKGFEWTPDQVWQVVKLSITTTRLYGVYSSCLTEKHGLNNKFISAP